MKQRIGYSLNAHFFLLWITILTSFVAVFIYGVTFKDTLSHSRVGWFAYAVQIIILTLFPLFVLCWNYGFLGDRTSD